MTSNDLCVHKCNEGKRNCKDTDFAKCHDKCPFYQTAKQKKESDKKCRKRLESLSEDEQQAISDKFYQGKKSWDWQQVLL